MLASLIVMLSLCQPGPEVSRVIAETASVVESDPSDPEAHARLGLAYAANDLWSDARGSFDRARALEGSRPVHELYYAICLDQLGQVDGAADVLSGLVDFMPAMHRLGIAYVRMGRIDEAAEVFRRMLDIDSASAFAEAGLGEVALLRGDYEAARAHLDKALAGGVNVYAMIGRAYRGLGLDFRARIATQLGRGGGRSFMPDEYSEAMVLLSVAPDAVLQRSTSLMDTGRFDEAIELLQDALERRPDAWALRNNLAVAHLRRGEVEVAESVLAPIAGEGAAWEVHMTLASCALRRGRLDDALVHADAAIQAAPATGEPYFRKAEVLLARSELEAAVVVAEEGLRRDPRNANVHLVLARVQAHLGRKRVAIEHLRTATRLAPVNAAAWNELGALATELEEEADVAAARAALQVLGVVR